MTTHIAAFNIDFYPEALLNKNIGNTALYLLIRIDFWDFWDFWIFLNSIIPVQC